MRRIPFLKTLAVLGALFLTNEARSQNLSNKGTDFWVGYGHHQFMETGTNTQEMVLYFSAEQAATVTVTIDSSGDVFSPVYKKIYNVPANTVISTETAVPIAGSTGNTPTPTSGGPMPKTGIYDARLFTYDPLGAPGEGIFRHKGIHITSDVPIVAYAHIYGSASSGATMLMPTETWGYVYTTINSKQQYANNCYSWVYVIAIHDSTAIEVTPAVQTRRGRPADQPFTVYLNRGQIFQFIGSNPTNSATALELTGSKVKSIDNGFGKCYPIAVFCGSSRTSNPATCGSGGGDNDNQQMFPLQAWGRRYLTAPFSGSTDAATFMTHTYKIAVKDPTITVKRNGVLLTGANHNVYTYESNTADYIEADGPICVAQFMTGGNGCLAGPLGDPEMVYISPIEQAIKRIGFYRNTKEAIQVNYLTLIIPTNGVSSLQIDGSNTFDHTYAHPNLPGYTVVVKRWPASQAQATAQSDSAFTAVTYGLGSVESYGYNAGTLINNLSAFSGVHNVADTSSTTHTFTCTRTPAQLSMWSWYKPTKIVWNLSALAVISPNTNVTDLSPVPTDSVIQNGNKYYKYVCAGTYQFLDTGTFYLPVDNTSPILENCNNTEEVKLIYKVKMKPKADFAWTHTGCLSDTIYFNSPANSGNGYTINHWNWVFPGGGSSTLQNPNVVIPFSGAQNVSLNVITTEGCVGDTTRVINIFPRPAATFGITPPTVCEGGSVTLSDTSSYAGGSPVNAWYWDFGNGSPVVNATTNANQNATYNTYGTYTIKHVVKVSNTCISDTAKKTVLVYAKPRLSFDYPAGCLPPGGVVQFNSTTTVPDGQTLSIYAWNFGDPNATAGNPNTSSLPNPTHTYSNFGNYNIYYSVTTANGCFKDTTVAATFNIRPALAYAALTPVCESLSGTVSVASGSVTNGVTGNGVYHGPATDLSGNFSPSTAGAGTHTIWYVFTSTGGCTDSTSQTILVRAKPNVNFAYPASGCLPNTTGFVQFTNGTTISDGQGMTYQWNFGDPNATAGNPNTSTATSPSHNYTDFGTYTITLTATTTNGCVNNKPVTVSYGVKPALTYPALATTCENLTSVSVATASVTNGVSGSGIYKGPGTSAAGIFNPSVAGNGTHTIWYVFTSTGSCVDSISQTISVRAKPTVDFSYPASGCLPNTTGFVQFTNATTIADGQGMTYQWNFGDPNASAGNPNTSTATSPSHNYTDFGTYTITLTATTTNGCTDNKPVTVSYGVKPALTYPALPATCQNLSSVSVATASVTNGVSGSGIYKGPGTSAAGIFDPSVAGNGTHTVWYVFTSTGSCVDSVSQTILVRAKPAVDFSYPASGCLPNTTGFVQFTNATTIADGQGLTYQWNFGDPNASAGNPNTSTVTSPTHNYTDFGTYTITLTATTTNGCTDNKPVTVSYGVKPLLAYPALASVCESSAAISVATASVTNGVTGTGVYSGPGTTAAGMFDPAVAGPGSHNITYTFTSNGGCIETISRNIKVHPKPNVQFNATPDVCLNQATVFSDNSSILTGNNVSWEWTLGDGNVITNTNNAGFNHTYGSAIAYNVVLVVKSDSGCVGTLTKAVNVHPLPVADFSMPTSVCMPNGTVAFTNHTSVADNSALTYLWNFGDASATSTDVSPSHIYSAISSYNIQLTATSAWGCKHDTTKSFSAFFDKPVALFRIVPDTLCQGTSSTFIDMSTAPNSTISSRKWDFGDGSPIVNGTGANIDKTYALPGTYTVNLTVTNAVGCVSDPYPKTVVVYLQPVIDAGPSFVVRRGSVITFRPTANDSSVLSFRWTPVWSSVSDLLNPGVLRPTITALNTQTYKLTATGQGSCTASDTMNVKILLPVKVPNAFSPNGDAINDKWVIENLSDYPGATVEVFNRYGQLIYHSDGYSNPWDGRYKGTPLPVATYYYIINLKNGFDQITGSVTIIR